MVSSSDFQSENRGLNPRGATINIMPGRPMVEHDTVNVEVGGSSPLLAAKNLIFQKISVILYIEVERRGPFLSFLFSSLKIKM